MSVTPSLRKVTECNHVDRKKYNAARGKRCVVHLYEALASTVDAVLVHYVTLGHLCEWAIVGSLETHDDSLVIASAFLHCLSPFRSYLLKCLLAKRS